MTKNRAGIFDKLFILHLICTTILFLIIIASYYHIEKKSYDDLLIKKSDLIRDLLEISFVDPIVNTIAYDRIVQSIEALYKKNHEIIYIEIYDPTAHIIASVGDVPDVHFNVNDINALRDQGSGSGISQSNKKDGKELITFLEAGGHNLGLIRIEFTRKYLYKQLKGNIMYFLGFFVIAIAITSLLFYLFTNIWIVSPIADVSKMMKNYGRDELHTILINIKKYNQTIGNDEIGVMSSAFERMVSSIIQKTDEKEKAEQQYRLIAENIADVIWTMDMDLKFTYLSPSVYQQRGFTVEEAMSQSLEEVLLPDSLEKVLNIFQRKKMFLETGALEGWKPEVFEIEQYCKDGTTIWVSSNVMIYPDSDGNPAGIVGTTRNIDDRKQAELALMASERNYREIFNATNDAIFIHDADTGKILDVNKGMQDMYGYTYQEAVQLDLGKLSSGVHPYTLEEAGGKVQKTVLHGSHSFDWLSRKKDDTLFWGEVSLKYVEISEQRYVLAVVRDVNARKLAEKSLAEEKEQLAVTLRSIGDGVITTDISGNIILLNKVAEDLTGWNSEEAVGIPSGEIFRLINKQTREDCDNPITNVIDNGQVTEFTVDAVLVARDGTERSIAESGAPILDIKGNIIGVVLVFRDESEKQRLEQEALKVRKLESVGVLAGGIAHDFNNILTAILGNINLALTFTNPNEEIYAILFEAEKASLRAKGLTHQLLTFSKGGEPVRKTTSIVDVITDSSSFVLRGGNVRCDTWFEPDLLPVDIDPEQISQVVQNIIINADHAMPQGGVIDIRVKNVLEQQDIPSSLLGDRCIVVSIKDNGSGIPHEIIDNVFDPYFSTKQTGSGLGLAICHSIITQHGGHITIESEPGKGTTISIYLSVSQNQLPESIDQESCLPISGHGKIMIMDDEEMVRNIGKAMLTHLGYEVEVAVDGEEAINMYEKNLSSGTQADLVIMDLTIPGGKGGEDAVKEILAINSEAKIIVSSGYSNDPIMANYKDYGFCGAVEKPYQMQELNRIVSEVLGKQIT